MAKRAVQPDRERRLAALLQAAFKQHEVAADELGIISLEEVKRALMAVDDTLNLEHGDERLIKHLLPRHGLEAVGIGGGLWRRKL